MYRSTCLPIRALSILFGSGFKRDKTTLQLYPHIILPCTDESSKHKYSSTRFSYINTFQL